ncbi:hypothetical protein A2U01_0101310, partial [Trifolium medium]|nr:hypothetical protein [Trifolium medium]
SEVEKGVGKTLVFQNPKSIETLDESRTVAESAADVIVQSFVPVNVQMGVSGKVTTGPVAESVKENATTPDVAQD